MRIGGGQQQQANACVKKARFHGLALERGWF
jgi:hypothetical protein